MRSLWAICQGMRTMAVIEEMQLLVTASRSRNLIPGQNIGKTVRKSITDSNNRTLLVTTSRSRKPKRKRHSWRKTALCRTSRVILKHLLTAWLKTRFMSGIPTNGLRKKENITKGVCRKNTHIESVQSQKIQSSPIMEISRQRMPHFRRSRRKNLPTKKYRRLLISQKRTAGSYRRQRIRCRKSGSMRWSVSLMNRPEKQSMWWFR